MKHTQGASLICLHLTIHLSENVCGLYFIAVSLFMITCYSFTLRPKRLEANYTKRVGLHGLTTSLKCSPDRQPVHETNLFQIFTCVFHCFVRLGSCWSSKPFCQYWSDGLPVQRPVSLKGFRSRKTVYQCRTHRLSVYWNDPFYTGHVLWLELFSVTRLNAAT